MRPMIFRRKPARGDINAFLKDQTSIGFSYDEVGATAVIPPAGYVVDHNRIRLGEGEGVFESARQALERWTHFDLGWVQATPPELSIQVGGMVAVSARGLGLWFLMACRIVYVISDTDGPIVRSGFAYGTLPSHAESGEERFLIEWNREDDSVWYDILAFSRPNGLLFRAGYPWLRILQRRFARDSKAAMFSAVNLAR